MIKNVLQYPGSKWNIASQLVELIPGHHSYVEPFFGSGAVFFHKVPSRIETINDLDSDVVNLFSCIQKDAEKLAGIVLTTPYSREVYNQQFSADIEEPFQKAASFLIRSWQGQGFRTNSYVGWKSDVQGRESMYNLWNWYRLPGWIIDIAERLRMVQIEHCPAIELIRRYNYENVFQYLDPPYLLKTRSNEQYPHEMSDTEHEELLKEIVNSKAKIMISGYESDMYNEYLSGWNKVSFSSCAIYGKSRVETVWMNYQIGQMSIRDFL